MKTFLFNPYTGKPRHPSDIVSDPQGIMIAEPDAPMRPAEPTVWVVVCMNDKSDKYEGVDPEGPIVHETYVRKATREEALKRAAALERWGACRIARLVFE